MRRPRVKAGPPLTGEARAELLASVIPLFAARGVEAATLPEIARETGVCLATLQREFGTKESLFGIAVRELARGHVARICRDLPPGPAVEQLRNFCGRAWEFLRTPTAAALDRVWLLEAARDPELARFYAEEVFGAVHGVLVGIVERGMAAGEFQVVSPRVVARLMIAALGRQAFWCNHPALFGPALAGGCNRIVAETLSIVLGGLQPSREESRS